MDSIDLGNRLVLHDCADWSRVLPSKRFCKHVGKLLLSLLKWNDFFYRFRTFEAILNNWKITEYKEAWHLNTKLHSNFCAVK